MQANLKVVDLFSGCGGFSLGAHMAGLSPVLAIDIDPILTSSFSKNFPNTKLRLASIATITGSDVEREAGGRIDGVFGGPPCQAFSDIGKRRRDDPRRLIVYEFFRLVVELRPTFFVLENVKGLAYAGARPVLDDALSKLPGIYNVLEPVVLDAADFGAATRRPRLFVVGYDPERFAPLTVKHINAVKRQSATVSAAIRDLASAVMIGESDGHDVWRITRSGRPSDYARELRNAGGTFTGHRRTVHTPAVRARFESIAQGAVDSVGRHPRLKWSGQCPTLRAGTGNDRGSYQSVRPIHPDEPRVITVREAARLQGFPDSFRFHTTIWHSYRMIGNSVSPFMAKAIFSLIADRVANKRVYAEAAE